MKQSATKERPEDNSTSVTKTKTASKVFVSNSQQRETKKQMPSSSTNTHSRCNVCKGNHRLWECRVFKEKTLTQRAKLVADIKLCFSCLRDKHTFRQCPQPKKCRAEGCNSSRNTLLHGEIGFSQENSHQILIPFSLLATQVKVEQLLVGSRLIRPQRCHLLLMLRGFFR